MTNYVNQRSECIKYDLSQIGDMFGWLEEVRGLDVGMLDAENVLDRQKPILEWAKQMLPVVREQGIKQKELVRNWDAGFHHWLNERNEYAALEDNIEYEVNELCRLIQAYNWADGIIESLEGKVAAAEAAMAAYEKEEIDDPDDRPEEPGYNKTYWNEVWREWDLIYDFLLKVAIPLGYSAFLFDLVEQKLIRKEITRYHACRILSLLALRLGWKSEYKRLAAMSTKLTGGPNTKDYEPETVFKPLDDDRFYGEISFNENAMINAIDARAAARRMDIDVYDLYDDGEAA